MRSVEPGPPPEVVDALDAEAEDRDETRNRVAAEMIGEWLERRSGSA